MQNFNNGFWSYYFFVNLRIKCRVGEKTTYI